MIINALSYYFFLSQGFTVTSYEPKQAEEFISKLKEVYGQTVEEGKKSKVLYLYHYISISSNQILFIFLIWYFATGRAITNEKLCGLDVFKFVLST